MHLRTCGRQRGVTLVEVLISLVVVAIGLLGIAKMQALAIASTRVSSMRSLIAIEISSMASAMHANRVYWAAVGAAGGTFQVALTSGANGGAITSATDQALTGAPTNCQAVSANCVGAPMALYDLMQWGAALYYVMPTSSASVTCSAGTNPVCTISVSWTETYVNLNSSVQNANGTVQQTYSMMVQP